MIKRNFKKPAKLSMPNDLSECVHGCTQFIISLYVLLLHTYVKKRFLKQINNKKN